MCLASVYSEINGEKKLLMSKVARLQQEPEGLVCRDFLGRSLSIKGSILNIDLENNIIICSLAEEQ